MKALLLLLCVVMAGCAIPQGDIISMTTTVIGIRVGENPKSQMPEVQIGFFRSTFQFVPTSTNTIYAPQVNSSLSLDQKMFSTSVDEDFTTGGAVAAHGSVAQRGAMMRGKTAKKPIKPVPNAPTNSWPYLDWDPNLPPLPR